MSHKHPAARTICTDDRKDATLETRGTVGMIILWDKRLWYEKVMGWTQRYMRALLLSSRVHIKRVEGCQNDYALGGEGGECAYIRVAGVRADDDPHIVITCYRSE